MRGFRERERERDKAENQISWISIRANALGMDAVVVIVGCAWISRATRSEEREEEEEKKERRRRRTTTTTITTKKKKQRKTKRGRRRNKKKRKRESELAHLGAYGMRPIGVSRKGVAPLLLRVGVMMF